MRIWIPVFLLLLLLTAAGCARSGDAGPVPTVAPTMQRVDVNTAGTGVDSPRVTPGPDERVPPTWTPVPRATAPPVLATRTPEFGQAPGAAVSQGEVYVVVAGDTLAEIAGRFDVDLDLLAAANGIEVTDTIEVGQFLVIPR
jgi:nucleoid-associated protein YgaU